jgi:hypothetical protein
MACSLFCAHLTPFDPNATKTQLFIHALVLIDTLAQQVGISPECDVQRSTALQAHTRRERDTLALAQPE